MKTIASLRSNDTESQLEPYEIFNEADAILEETNKAAWLSFIRRYLPNNDLGIRLDNGSQFVFSFETSPFGDGETIIDGYTYTIYDSEGDEVSTDGDEVETIDDFDKLISTIVEWAASNYDD